MPACLVCETEFEQRPNQQGGRPAIYCCQECREVSSLRSRLETLIPGVARRAKAAGKLSALSKLRGEFFRLGNLFNSAGKPVESGTASRSMTRSGWRGLRRNAG